MVDSTQIEDSILLIDPAPEVSMKVTRDRVVVTTTGKGGLSIAVWSRMCGIRIQEAERLNVAVIGPLHVTTTDIIYDIVVSRILQRGSFGELVVCHPWTMLLIVKGLLVQIHKWQRHPRKSAAEGLRFSLVQQLRFMFPELPINLELEGAMLLQREHQDLYSEIDQKVCQMDLGYRKMIAPRSCYRSVRQALHSKNSRDSRSQESST